MKVVYAVIRNSILAADISQAETIAELEDIYRIGLQYPDKVDADNIQKLFENPLMMRLTGKAFKDLDPRGGVNPAVDEFRRKYAEHAVRRLGLRSPTGKAAVRRASLVITDEFRAEFDIPLNPRDL